MGKRKPSGYWTKEKCKEVVSTCKTLKDLRKADSTYRAIYRNGWYDELCSHLKKRMVRSPYYWTKERCREEALKFKNRAQLNASSSGAYHAIYRNGWYNELCSHLEIFMGNGLKINYAFEFSDNHVYVGLTYNIGVREKQHYSHNKRSQVSKHIQKTGLKPKLSYDKPKSVEEALELEVKMYEKYQSEGWILLTKRCGGLGSTTIKWTKQKCFDVALKCKTKQEFSQRYKSASDAAYRNGWMEDITKHMKKRKPNGYWDDKERCREEALKYDNFSALNQNNKTVTFKILEHGWVDELYSHFYKNVKRKKPSGYWTKERCREESLKYKSRKELALENSSVYQKIIKNKWYVLLKHMS